jgi:hypothetical protein
MRAPKAHSVAARGQHRLPTFKRESAVAVRKALSGFAAPISPLRPQAIPPTGDFLQRAFE